MREERDEALRDATLFMLPYKFGLQEVLTKVDILREELTHAYEYNPIEHVKSRLKSPDSILDKAYRSGCDLTATAIRAAVLDIAGLRITCSFISDVYEVAAMLTAQPDLTVVSRKDYIAAPKPNGYRSLHLLLEVPVFLSNRVEPVRVEAQLRTVSMDLWASLEHKAAYKFDGAVPDAVAAELRRAADVTRTLDERVEALRGDIARPGREATGSR